MVGRKLVSCGLRLLACAEVGLILLCRLSCCVWLGLALWAASRSREVEAAEQVMPSKPRGVPSRLRREEQQLLSLDGIPSAHSLGSLWLPDKRVSQRCSFESSLGSTGQGGRDESNSQPLEQVGRNNSWLGPAALLCPGIKLGSAQGRTSC